MPKTSIDIRPMHRGKTLRISALALSIALLGAGCSKGDPYSVAQHIERAKAELAAKHPNAASIELKTALQQERNNVLARLLLADSFIALNQGQAAEVELDRAQQFGAKP